jgi:hypothetical protein
MLLQEQIERLRFDRRQLKTDKWEWRTERQPLQAVFRIFINAGGQPFNADARRTSSGRLVAGIDRLAVYPGPDGGGMGC